MLPRSGVASHLADIPAPVPRGETFRVRNMDSQRMVTKSLS